MGALKLISGAAGYMKAVGQLRTIEAPEIITAGGGAIAALILAIPVFTGHLTPSQAVDAGGVILMGLGGLWTGVSRIQAGIENQRKAKAKKSLNAAEGEIQAIQTTVKEIVPDLEVDGQAPVGGKTQVGVEALVDAIANRPAAVQHVKSEIARTPPKHRQPKPMNGGRGSK